MKQDFYRSLKNIFPPNKILSIYLKSESLDICFEILAHFSGKMMLGIIWWTSQQTTNFSPEFNFLPSFFTTMHKNTAYFSQEKSEIMISYSRDQHSSFFILMNISFIRHRIHCAVVPRITKQQNICRRMWCLHIHTIWHLHQDQKYIITEREEQ